MSAALMTVPHARITRLNVETGETDHPEIGSFVNVRAARSIEAIGPILIVELPGYRWSFDCVDDGQAAKLAKAFAIRAAR